MIKVAVIDEVDSRQLEIKKFIDAQPDLSCQFTVRSVTGLFKITNQPEPNVILIYLTDDGAGKVLPAEVRKIKVLLPEAEVIIMADNRDTKKMLAFLRAGIVGYLPLNTSLERLKEAIVGVRSGGAYIVPYMVRQMLSYFRSQEDLEEVLTLREREIVQCLVEGMSYKLIAVKLDIALDTVRYHLRNIYKKLHVNSKSQVVGKAVAGDIVL